MSWRFLKGKEEYSTVKVGAAAVKAGDPVQFSGGVMVAVADGSPVHGVMHEDGDADETKRIMQHLVPGTVWEVPVSGQTLARGTRVALAGADGSVDAGTSGNPSPGYIVDYDVTTAHTVAHLYIDPGTIA